MATPLKLYFSNEFELYNAVYLANAIGDTQPGSYDITLQATGSGQVPNASVKNLNAYDTTPDTQLDANELQAVIADLIDPTANEIFDGSVVLSSGAIIGTTGSVRDMMFGYAPAIRHDLTINFELESKPGESYFQPIQRATIIDVNAVANSRDYSLPTDLVTQNPVGAGFFATGFKIDNFNPNQQINVTFNGFLTNSAGSFFYESPFAPGEDRSQFSDVGVWIDNSENLTINGMFLGPASIVGNGRDPSIPQAQVINRAGGNLSLTGDVVVGPALNYSNSLAYNQGTLAIDNANIRVYDKNSPLVIDQRARFGGAERAIGAINNVGTLAISNSRLSQEADNKVNSSSVNEFTFYNNVFGRNSAAGLETPGWTAPVTLEYLISNSGSTSISNSVIAGILRQQGSSAASLSLQNSNLGYGETPRYDNLIIDSGSYSVNTSTVDRISTAIRPSQLSNSVILSSARPDVVAASDDIAYRQFLDPNRPSLFAASKENVPLFIPATYAGEFWRSTYDPAQLNPAVQAAVAAALQGSSGGGSTGGGGGGSTGGGGGGSTGGGGGGSTGGGGGGGSTGGGGGGSTGGGGGSTDDDSIIKATLRADRLIGTNKPDTFLFPNIRTGTNPKTSKNDRIIGYQSDDIIKIKGFEAHVIGENPKRRKIFNSYGTVRNLSKKAINELLGDNFKPRDAAVFQVQGIRGSFLAVNKRGVGFNKNDMLVHFVDFVPSSDSPLTLA